MVVGVGPSGSAEGEGARARARRLLLVSGVKLDISARAENGNWLSGEELTHVGGMLHGVMYLPLPAQLPSWVAARAS